MYNVCAEIMLSGLMTQWLIDWAVLSQTINFIVLSGAYTFLS